MSLRKSPTTNDRGLIMSSVEIIAGRLYFMALKTTNRPTYTSLSHYFTVDDDLLYEPFFEDFGPLNLAQLYKYCKHVCEKLNRPSLATKKIVHYTSSDPKKRVNAAYLIGSFAILCLHMDVAEVYRKLTSKAHYTDFRDASIGMPVYTISLRDCLQAVAKAKECKFFDPYDFNYDDYVHYETVQNGDLNWVVPDKFVAFAGPQSLDYNNVGRRMAISNPVHTPESYLKYFKAMNVTTVVRLNSRCYDASKFTKAGIEHYDLIYVDGGTPSDDLVDDFLRIAEKTTGAVAVHCKAGLGRTGSMIACYIMKWYHFTAREAIAWLRICRPASIIGPQQHWLEEKQRAMWLAGEKVRKPHHEFGVYSWCSQKTYRGSSAKEKSSNESLSSITSQVTTMKINNADINKNPVDLDEVSQGDHLQRIKLDRQPIVRPKAMRCSWPVVVASSASKRGSLPSAPTIGKRVTIKRMSARKKTFSASKSSAEENISRATPPSTPAIVVDSPTVPLRRSQRVLETRPNRSLHLR